MEYFQGKAHLVARGHMTHTMDVITYSSVVMRETLCIAPNMAALYDLMVKAADTLNAYETTPNREKIWTVVGS